MKTAICLLIVVACSGCFTPRKIDRERRVFQLQAKQGMVLAGVDVFGLKEAFQADPAGTTGAVTLDALLGAGAALAVGLVANEIDGDKGDSVTINPDIPARPDRLPQGQNGVIIYNAGDGTVNYEAGNSYGE